MRFIRSSLKTAGGLLALAGAGLLIFYSLFVYPRPSRLPDPLRSVERSGAPGERAWTEAVRLAELTVKEPSAWMRSSPRWDEALSALKAYPYTADVASSGRARLQAGVGQIERGEMEAMDALLAPAPTDLAYGISIPKQGLLTLAMAVLPPKQGPPPSARFIVRVDDPNGGGDTVTVMDRRVATAARKDPNGFWDDIKEYLHPDIRGKYGNWERAELDLSRWEGRTVRLIFSTRPAEGSGTVPLAVWGNPVLYGIDREESPRRTNLNVLMILVDAMRPDALGVYGSNRHATPNIDRLAREGAIFKQARSPSVDTRTSESSLFTGRYPNEIGIHYRNRGLEPVEVRHFHALAPETLPERFGKAGYLTGAFANNMFLLEFSGTGYNLDFQDIYNNNRTTLDTVDLTDRTVAWLARNKERRFFLFVNFNSPHGRYQPPIKNLLQVAGPLQLAGHDLRSWYLGSVAYVDDYVGVLRTALERLGLLDRTLIVISADHGQVFDPAHVYGIPDKQITTYNRHGYTLYDEEVRVPLILRLPGKIEAGRVVEDPVSLVDLFPTAEELAGMPKTEALSGRSLVPLLKGDPLPPKPVYAEGNYMKAVVDDGLKYIYREEPAARLLHRTPQGDRLVHLPEELYDLKDDPQEHRNLIGSERDASAALSRKMWGRLRDEGPRDLIVNQVRFVAGGARHVFTGRVSVPEEFPARIRFFETVSGGPDSGEPPRLRQEGYSALAFSTDLPEGRWTGFFFETEPPEVPIRLDLLMDGQPIEANRLYGGPMGLAGLVHAGETLPAPALAFLDSREGIFEEPIYDPRYETGAFVWRTPYLDYVSATDANSGLSREVRDILFDWGYIQKDEKR
jgi:arylsulfatase A-like enzyme